MVYHNREGSAFGNYFDGSCTTPLPPQGFGNIRDDPQLLWNGHLSSTSPCLGAGIPGYARGLGVDGEPWAVPPAMGADQAWPAAQPGLTLVRPSAMSTKVATAFPMQFTALDTSPLQDIVWDFGDGSVVTNQLFLQHAWTAPGTYTVRLTTYNDSHPRACPEVW